MKRCFFCGGSGGLPHHVFWADDTAIANSQLIALMKIQGHRQVTDAHLLALALRQNGRLATLDRGVRHLVPNGFSANEAIYLLMEA
jgi:predicted nucleic acid-binding protein